MVSIQFVLREKTTAKRTLIPEKIPNKNSTVEFPPIKDTIQYMSYHVLFEGVCFVLSYSTHIWNAHVGGNLLNIKKR